MNRVVNNHSPPGDPLDALLGAYFKAELPAPWPPFQRPARTRVSPRPFPPGRRPILAARFALAASVGLLFAAGWLLPSLAPADAHRRGGNPDLRRPHGRRAKGAFYAPGFRPQGGEEGDSVR